MVVDEVETVQFCLALLLNTNVSECIISNMSNDVVFPSRGQVGHPGKSLYVGVHNTIARHKLLVRRLINLAAPIYFFIGTEWLLRLFRLRTMEPAL